MASILSNEQMANYVMQSQKATEWERGFAESMVQLFQKHWTMSDKQRAVWERITQKFFPSEVISASAAPVFIDDSNFKPMFFTDLAKKKLQFDAFNAWELAGCKGTVIASTGSGKSQIGIMAIRKHLGKDTKAVIIVPQISIAASWVRELSTQLKGWVLPGYSCIEEMIGFLGAGKHDVDKPIVIAILNSTWGKRILADLVVLDEVHHIGSELSIRVLKESVFIKPNQKILGLTAEIEREDDMDEEIVKILPVVFSHSHKDGVREGLISKYELINIAVPLTPAEAALLEKFDTVVANASKRFNNGYKSALDILGHKVDGTSEERQLAYLLIQAIQKRKKLLNHASFKPVKAVEVVVQSGFRKTIVFCMFIQTIRTIVQLFKEQGYGDLIGYYHSKMTPKEKAQMLQDFKDNKIKVIVAARALDEGVNIPDADQAVVVGGSKVERQTIQRLGRVLRKEEGKQIARIVQLYIPGTMDERWLRIRSRGLSPISTVWS